MTETRTGPLGCSNYDNLDSVSSVLVQSPENKIHLQGWPSIIELAQFLMELSQCLFSGKLIAAAWECQNKFSFNHSFAFFLCLFSCLQSSEVNPVMIPEQCSKNKTLRESQYIAFDAKHMSSCQKRKKKRKEEENEFCLLWVAELLYNSTDSSLFFHSYVFFLSLPQVFRQCYQSIWGPGLCRQLSATLVVMRRVSLCVRTMTAGASAPWTTRSVIAPSRIWGL